MLKGKGIIEESGKEKLEKIISESGSITDIFRKYGLAASGASFKKIRKLTDKWNIDLFFSEENIRKSKSNRFLETKDIFCMNSNVSRSTLKKAIIRDNLLDNTKCSICNIGNTWNNKPITMILDHINGLRNDNRIENLRFVCPMCNSQLDTTGSKNPYYPHGIKKYFCIDCEKEISQGSRRCIKCSNLQPRKKKTGSEKKKNYCMDCGKEISKLASRCIECSNTLKNKIIRPSSETLKKDIEILGKRGTGRKYGVAPASIRRWIKKYKS